MTGGALRGSSFSARKEAPETWSELESVNTDKSHLYRTEHKGALEKASPARRLGFLLVFVLSMAEHTWLCPSVSQFQLGKHRVSSQGERSDCTASPVGRYRRACGSRAQM